jgi:hypothetical protein
MKQAAIVALICVNLALIGILAFGVATPEAKAQVRGAPNFMIVTSQWTSDEDAVYVIDLKSQRLLAWTWNKTNKNLEPYFGRDLQRDFNAGR